MMGSKADPLVKQQSCPEVKTEGGGGVGVVAYFAHEIPVPVESGKSA
jgi:hypothetical protein